MTDLPTPPTPPFPLVNEDGDWFAFPGDWSKRDCVGEIVHNLTDWYLDDNTTIDDEDKVHGWVAAYRQLFGVVTPGFVRPADPTSDWEPSDWWFETDDKTAYPAMLVRI